MSNVRIPRPPIVAVLGHVDHGKTTLLDYIRKTNVAAREAGGITQSIGAYEINREGIRMTFVDTPGHAAFSAMRSRGAKVADIALLVVAADDGVQPQTKEAFKIIQEEEVPCIVVINKIDRSGVEITRVKGDLASAGILLEGYGGSVSYQAVSAKTGEGVNDLLALIKLTAEIEGFSYDPSAAGAGYVIEAHVDSRRGAVASGIVTDGTVRAGDGIRAGDAYGKIRVLENFLRKPITEASPSSPVVMVGFETLPKVGETFSTGSQVTKDVVSRAPLPPLRAKSVAPIPAEGKGLRVILKADVAGSLEALEGMMRALALPQGMEMKIIEASLGDISDGDVKLAISTRASIVAFRVKTTKAADYLAKANRVRIITSDIVYELLKAVEQEVKALEGETVKGVLQVLAVFGQRGPRGWVVGGRVTEGMIANHAAVEVMRRGAVAGEGRIVNLQSGRRDVKEVTAGDEAGLLLESSCEIKVGDVVLVR